MATATATAVQDVEMTDATDRTETTEETRKDADVLTLEDIRQQVKHIEKAVSTKEQRFMSRALRVLVTLRKKLNSNVLRRAIQGLLTTPTTTRNPLLDYLDEPMDVDTAVARPRSNRTSTAQPLPEVDVYVHLLVVIYLIDQNKHQQAQKCADALMGKLSGQNRRTLDMLAAKCYFYYSRTYELLKQLDKIRLVLHSRLRTSTLRSDHEGQATLLNLLLRNYLEYNLYDQADKLVSKAPFPETASNNESARYLYYLGRIKAIQLEYSEARKNLNMAMRKAPQHTAVGFKQTAQKFAIVVELLLGDIPDKAIFNQPTMRKTLQPYFQLTQAVRTGSLNSFNEVMAQYRDKFLDSGTYTLIVRLRHNVIKAGVRMINLSYSRISLADIAAKLQLGTSEDAEYIVAKAIRDGVIEATIDHERRYVQSKENPDVYSTREPMNAFHQRIAFCLDIHNQSVKAMRFPPKSYNKDLESAEERREREAQEMETAKEIAEDDFDDFP